MERFDRPGYYELGRSYQYGASRGFDGREWQRAECCDQAGEDGGIRNSSGQRSNRHDRGVVRLNGRSTYSSFRGQSGYGSAYPGAFSAQRRTNRGILCII